MGVATKRWLGSLSGVQLLSASFVILCVLTVLLTNLLLLGAAKSVVDRVLQKAANQAQQAAQNEIEFFLRTPDVLLSYVSSAINSRFVDANDVESFQSLLWNTPGRGHLIPFSSVYYATSQGELIGLGSRNLEWPLLDWTFSLSTAKTDNKYTIIDPTGDGMLSERRLKLDTFDARLRPWFIKASASRGTATWSDLYTDFESGNLTLSRAQASFDKRGNMQGVVGVDMHIRHLKNYLEAQPLSANGEMFLVDSEGLLLAAAAPSQRSIVEWAGLPMQTSQLRFSTLTAHHVDEDLGGFSKIISPYRKRIKLDGEPGFLYIAPVGHEHGLQWALGIFLPESDYLGSIAAHAKRVVPMIILIVVAGCAIVTGFIHLIVKPLKQLRRNALLISEGEFDVAIDTSYQNESGDIARAVDYMRKRLKQSFTELDEQKRLAETTLNSIADGVLAIDTDRKVTHINPVACQLLNVTFDDVLGTPVETLFKAIDYNSGTPLSSRYFLDALRRDKSFSKELLLSDSQGQTHPVHCRISYITTELNEKNGAVAIFSDLTEEQRLRAELVYQATHDDLTKLSNRRGFETRLSQAISSAKSSSDTHALCFIDLDQFKIINDTSGHRAGDEILRQIARILKDRTGEDDTIARLGGDEFGVLLERCTLAEAEAKIEKLRSGIANFRFCWKEHPYSLAMSAGLVSIDESTVSVMTVMRDADNACYIAKDSGKNRVHVARADNHALAHRRDQIRLLEQVNLALEEDRFVLYAQRIESTAPTETDTALRIEILLRMRGETNEIILPDTFLPAAEQFGLCSRIDRWVVHNTLKWIDQYSNLKISPDRYSINLSGQSLGETNFLKFMLDELDQCNVPKNWLCFEITETAAIADMGKALKLMHALREQGCKLALDDFGSGLSSFGYLKHLPLDYLKIDGQFIRDMLDNPLDLAMVRSINDIGQTMSMKTIAEFVDCEAARQQLQLLGVDFVQGYLLGEPHPLDDYLISTLSPLSTGNTQH